METLVNVAFPVFVIVALGYFAGRVGLLGPESAAALNRFVYFFALPSVLFIFTARAPIEQVLHWPFIGTFLGGSFLTLTLAAIVAKLVFRHDLTGMLMSGLSGVFANTAYMGVPIFLTAFGDQAVMPAIIATLFGIMLLIGGAIAVLETLRAKETSGIRVFGEVSGTLLRNPLIVAPLIGMAFSFFEIGVPKPIENLLDMLGATAGPGALFALGLSLVGQKLLGNISEVSWLVVLKIIVQPAITWLLVAHVFVLEPMWAQAAIILSALPTGALVFVVAQQYDVYVRRASAVIVLSTAISIITVSALLILFGVG